MAKHNCSSFTCIRIRLAQFFIHVSVLRWLLTKLCFLFAHLCRRCMSESEDASGAPRVDYSSIAVLERQLNRINAKLDELFEKRALAISDGKSKEQLEALNALYASRETKLEAEKKEKEAELKELLTQATTARRKRTYGEVAQSPITLPAAVQPTEAGSKRSRLHIRYKADAAVKIMRTFLTKVAEHLVSIELVPAPRPGKWAKATTYGDVQAAYACANEVAKEAFDSLLPKATWKYLSKLNSWCNRQLHEAELPKVGGRVKLVCPGDCLDDVALLQAAAMIGLDADVLVSDQVSPDVSPALFARE